jgi:hypothetical protein
LPTAARTRSVVRPTGDDQELRSDGTIENEAYG